MKLPYKHVKQGVMIWGGVDLAWHILHIVFIAVIGLDVAFWFYFDIGWYVVMIIMDILVIVGANSGVCNLGSTRSPIKVGVNITSYSGSHLLLNL